MYFRGFICVLVLSIWMLYTVGAASQFAQPKPGIKVFVTERALSAAARSMLESVRGKSLPDVEIKHNGFRCTMYGMVTDTLSFTDTRVDLATRNAITYSLSDARITIAGRLKCKRLLKWHYRFTIRLSGLDMTAQIAPGISPSGNLTSHVESCVSNLDSTSCSVSGRFFHSSVKRELEKQLSKYRTHNALCEPLRDFVNSKFNSYLAQIPVEVPINGTHLFLNVRFLAPTTISHGHMETRHKGEFFYGRNRSEASFLPQPMTSPKPSEKMIMVCASDYVINTLGFVLSKNGLLKYKITKQNIPPEASGFLKTTCDGAQQCIGKVIPQIGEKFPNSSVEILTKATSAPTVHMAPNQVTGHLDTNVAFYIRQPSGKVSLGFDMKMALNMSGAGKIVRKYEYGYKMTASVKDIAFDVRVIKSKVGKLSDSFLKTVFGMAVKMFIIPELNKLGMKGYPLPSSVGPAAIMNPDVYFLKNTLCFDADATYKPVF